MPRQPIQADTWRDYWEKLKSGIHAILGRKQSKLKLTDLYDSVENLLITNPKILETALSDILCNHFHECISKLSVLAGFSLFDTLSQIIDDFYLYSLLFPMIFQLYDTHGENSVGSHQTFDLIRHLFQTIILDNTDLMKACITGLRKNFLAARNQSNYDIKNSNNLIKIFENFRTTSPLFDEFYQYLIEDTTEFYQAFYKSKFEDNSFFNYLELSLDQFSREIEIINNIFYTDPSQPKSEEKFNIFRCVFEQLISNHTHDFVSGNEPLISTALTSSNLIPFKWLISVYQKFNINTDIFCIACGNFIKRQMLALAPNFKKEMKTNEIQENISTLITTCQALSKPYRIIFSDVKNSNRILDKCIIEAWNDPTFDIEQNFCVYIDFQIRSEFKNMSQEEKGKFPSTVATFYSYLIDKFKFASIYDTFQVRRFIKMGLKLVEIELPTINAIKGQKAQGFAKNFKQYIKTFRDSQLLETSFKNELNHRLTKDQQQARFSFSPIVFDQKYFPLDKNIATMLPPQLRPIHNAFCSYYTEKRPNYKLMLIQDVSTVEFKLQIPRNSKSPHARTYTMTSDIICATIIEKLSKGPVKYQDIIGSANNAKLVDLHLKRLIQKELQILIVKNTGTKKQDNIFSLNPNFFSKAQRVVIPPVVNERKKDMVQITETVNNDKAHSIKAAIVRILKNKTRLPQPELENLVIIDMAPYFRADTGLIRRMINDLEAEEYLTKIKSEESQILEYIA